MTGGETIEQPWTETRVKQPTEQDADYFHRVLAATYTESLGWKVRSAYWTDVTRDPHHFQLWKPHPTMPNNLGKDVKIQ